MRLPTRDQTDQLIAEYEGIGAATELPPMTGADWRDYARRLERDMELLRQNAVKWLGQRYDAEYKLRDAERSLTFLRAEVRRLKAERPWLGVSGLFAGCLFSLFVVWLAVSL